MQPAHLRLRQEPLGSGQWFMTTSPLEHCSRKQRAEIQHSRSGEWFVCGCAGLNAMFCLNTLSTVNARQLEREKCSNTDPYRHVSEPINTLMCTHVYVRQARHRTTLNSGIVYLMSLTQFHVIYRKPECFYKKEKEITFRKHVANYRFDTAD